MLKYASYDIVFQEIPDEVTLAINLTNCPNRCAGCHSPHLREDIGDELTEERMAVLLDEYDTVTCVCFMGGDATPDEVAQMAAFVRQFSRNRLKTAWYSGKERLPENFQAAAFDYVKTGHYDARYGDLKSPTTNQRLYRLLPGQMTDITERFWKKGSLLCALLIGLCSVSLSAQTADTLRQMHIDEVTVTARRYAEVIPAQKLEGKELERLSVHSVADAIRYFAGVQIKDYGGVGGLKTVDIRSMGTNHLGVFYDGIQLGNAQNGQVDLGKFSMDNIEEISLYNGQKSEIFQPAKDFGSAGTIYLRTRRPHFTTSKNYNLQAVMRGGSFGLLNPSLLWEQQLTPRISSSLSAEYTHATGKYKFRYRRVFADGTVAWDTTAVRQNGDIEAFRAEAAVHGFVEQGKWSVKGYFYDSEKGIPGAIINNVWKRSQRQWDRNAFVQGSFQKELFSHFDFQANAKYANDKMRYLNPDTTLMYIDNTFLQQEVYLSAAAKYSIFKQWDVSLSSDYQWNILDATLQDFVYPKRHTILVAAATAFNLWRIKGQASVLGTFVMENVTRIQHDSSELLPDAQTGTPDNTTAITPAVFLSYKPFLTEDFNIRAFYKRIFRMPTFNDLYYTDVGNVSLQPEYTTQYNVGLQYTKPLKHNWFKAFEAKADAYYIEVTDKIIAVPKGNGQYRWMMMNIGYVEIRGIDAGFRTQICFPGDVWLHVCVNYTFQKAQDFSDPKEASTYGGQIAYIPWHSGSVVGQLTYKTWELNYSFIYVGERYHNSANIAANYEQPWYTHDLSVGKEFRFTRWGLKLTLEVNNVFDQQYDVVLNYPMPGRNYKGILKVMI